MTRGKLYRCSVIGQLISIVRRDYRRERTDMKLQRLLELGECPIMFPGGGFGLVIRWDDTCNEIGIQRPGADDIQWIHASEITEYGVGALVVTGPSGLI